jgi:hypothetical protein
VRLFFFVFGFWLWGIIVGMDVVRSDLDERLLSLARRSPSEIAELTGLDVGYVAERVAFLLESRDWLSDRQEERLLLVEAAALKDRAFAMLDSVGPNEFAGVANVVLRSLRLVSERLDSRRKLVDEDIHKITEAHARVFALAFDTALNHIVTGLRVDADVDDVLIEELVEQGLMRARVVLDAHLQ